MDKDRFIASMTFASHFGACDCDECEVPTTNGGIPTSIQEAVQFHKRQRLLHDTIAATVTQKRSLVARSMNNVSIWHLTLPPGSEPLTELGGSHRIVVVDSMPKVGSYSSNSLFIAKLLCNRRHILIKSCTNFPLKRTE